MYSDDVRSSGQVCVEHFGAGGELKKRLDLPNLVVDSGLAWIAARLTGSPAVMSHMAMGSNGTAPQNWHTALYSQTGRVALTASTSGKTTTYTATFGPGVATGTVSELGIFNASTGGTMLARVVFTPQQKGSEDTIKVTWAVTQSA